MASSYDDNAHNANDERVADVMLVVNMVNVKTEEMADRISPLSNALLARILSFLQIKDVVKTSILSWRWKYVWWKVPVFDLSGLEHPLKPSFIAFVYRALVLNDVPVLRLFCLDQVDEIEDFHVNSWIWSVMQRNVCEISLTSSILKKKRLVKALFSSETLRELNLYGKLIIPSVDKSMQHLPKLEFLQLTMVEFKDHNSFNALLSVCPSLVELILHECSGLRNVEIRSSTMRKLKIACAREVQMDIVIKAPRLEYIHLTGRISCHDIKLVGTLPCLIEVLFNVNCPQNDHHCGIIDLLGQTSKLTTLKMAQSMLDDTLEYYGAHLPVFRNLVLLELAHATIPFVLEMLDLTLNLATLSLCHISWSSDDQLTLPESTPECLSRSLKVVEINDFCGYGSPLRLAEYILTHAAVLKVMRIQTAQDDSESEMDGLVQLFMVRRSSRHCEFHICVPPED